MDGGERLQIASYGERREWAGRRIARIARDENIEPLDLVLGIVRSGGASIVNHSIDESDVRHVMQLPWVATASDGSARVPGATVPHPRSYGTFPRKIGHYSLREKVIPLEQAIHSATGLPARILGLEKRGYLRTGYAADVIVLDPERISDTATFEEPHRFSRGIVHVFVNGRPAISGGTPTGALVGRALRRPGSASSTAAVAASAVKSGSDPAGLAERVDSLFASLAKSVSPGCALGVIKDGELIYGRGYGSANLDYELPVKTDSVFYLASVSKQFVAACIALLAIDRKLALDDDIRKYIPELPDYGVTITIRHLVHHTSGLRSYLSLMELAGLRARDVHSRGDVLEFIYRQKTLNFQPGERYLYSNTGYFLLAEVVERVSGGSLRDYADEKLFAPLGMNSTHFHDDHTQVVKNRVVSYVNRAPDTFRVSYLASWDQVGSGGLLSTVDDLVRWDRNSYNRKVGGEALHKLLHTRGVLNDGTALDYAFGLVHGEYKGLRTVGHGGSFMGFRTVLLRFPEERFSVIILANLGTVNPGALARKVADVYLERSIGKSLAEYAGGFRSSELEVVYEVVVRGADLVARRGGTDVTLAPSAKRDEYSAGGHQLEFKRDATGQVNAFLVSTGRANNVRFDRVE